MNRHAGNSNRRGRGGGGGAQVRRNNQRDDDLAEFKRMTLNDWSSVNHVPHPKENPEVSKALEQHLQQLWSKIVPSSKSQEKVDDDYIEYIIKRYSEIFDEQPYWTLLRMLNSWNRFQSKLDKSEDDKFDIPIWILNIFENIGMAETEPSVEVKIASFRHFSEQLCNFTLLERAIKVFKYDVQPQDYLDYIKQLVCVFRYDIAGRWVTLLKLQKHFRLTDILLPLLVQGKMRLMQDYLDGEDEIRQKDFVLLLDKVCQNGQKLEKVIKRLDIPEAKFLKPRMLSKHGRQLAKKYDVQMSEVSNLKWWLDMSRLGYLINSHYQDGKIHQDDWEEFVFEFIDGTGNQSLKREAIRLAAFNEDMGRAIEWTCRWNVDRSIIDKKVAEAMDSRRSYPLKLPPTLPNDVTYYKPTLPQIYWVENHQQYRECMAYLVQSQVVGLDSEWKSKFGNDDHREKTKTAIFQIGTGDRIYLLDIIKLKSNLLVMAWRQLKMYIFDNPSITKLAFSFEDDWQGLTQICPEVFDDAIGQAQNFIDLRSLCDRVLDKWPDVYPYYDPDKEYAKKGLANYVELCFKFPLDKTEQISNWERRPLRETQEKYAALDVFCLVKMHQLIEQRCLAVKINYGELIEQCRQIGAQTPNVNI